ncbi:MAG: hypothetical protein ACYCQJ_02740 [Nitrososphaerales archaeon]
MNRARAILLWLDELEQENDLPPSCSKVCQCSNLASGCSHLPCGNDIARERNHTHTFVRQVVIREGRLEFEITKLCISPKCIGTSPEGFGERYPERSCRECEPIMQEITEAEFYILQEHWRIRTPKR